jgi:hypothetical protein
VEICHAFIEDMVRFMNEMMESLSSNSFIQLTAEIESNYLKGLLKQDGEKKMEDLSMQVNLGIDDGIFKKIKAILGDQIESSNEK